MILFAQAKLNGSLTVNSKFYSKETLMMTYLKNLASFILIYAVITQTAVAGSKNSVTFKNEKGSILTLNWHGGTATGFLDGEFTAKTGVCEKDKLKAMAINGYYNGGLVTISINFLNCNQVMAMTGYVSKDRSKLEVMRLITSEKNNDTKFSSDEFTKVKQ